MKKLLAVILALATVLAFAACGKNGGDTPGEEKSTAENAKSNEEETTKEDLSKIVSQEVQGVWLAKTDDTFITLYTFKDTKVKTYVVNFGKGASEALSGTFTVGEDKLNYKFSGGSGFSGYTYADGKLVLTDGNGGEIKKQSAADVMAVLTGEEAASNPRAVVILADIISEYFPDSAENAAVAEKKSAANENIKAQGEAALSKMRTDYDKVQKLTWYQPQSMPVYTDICCYIYPYIGHEDSGNTWLRLQLLYTDAQTDASWIFFNKVIFSVDGENTTKSFSRSELTRDNDTEVWEYADYEPTASDIELLRKIADSEETIIRFQGDEYHYDHTVTAKEKTAITDVLTAYNYLKYDKEVTAE